MVQLIFGEMYGSEHLQKEITLFRQLKVDHGNQQGPIVVQNLEKKVELEFPVMMMLDSELLKLMGKEKLVII